MRLKFIPYAVAFVLAVMGGFAFINVVKNMEEAVTDPAPPDTVFVSDTLVQTITRRGNEVEKTRLVDRIVTREIPADTVYVSQTDTVLVELPEYAIQEVDKEGRRLQVDVLSRNGKEGQRLVYTLPSDDSDFTLRSGNRPAILRADRRFDLFQFELSGEVTGGINVVTNTPTVIGQVRGPVSIGGKAIRVLPSVTTINTNVIVGGTLEF